MLEEEFAGQYVYKMIAVRREFGPAEAELVGKRFYSITPLGKGKLQLRFVDDPDKTYIGGNVHVISYNDAELTVGVSTRKCRYELQIVGGYGYERIKRHRSKK